MRKIISLILIVIIVSSAISGCFLDDIIKQIGFTTTNPDYEEIVWEEKIYWTGDINENFVPGQLMVLLDKAISAPQKVHNVEFFVGVEVVEIIDCKPYTNPNDYSPDFHQSLLLILSDKYNTKEATLEAMHILEPIVGIKAVEPNLILTWEVRSK